MKFFKKQRFNLIAAFVSIAFHVLLVILLSLKMREINVALSNREEEFSMDLQPENIPDQVSPPPQQVDQEEVKKMIEDLAKEIKPEELVEKGEERPETAQDLGEIPIAQKEDSVLLTALQTLLKEIQPPTIEDSIEIEKEIQESNKILKTQFRTDRRQEIDNDRKFLHDNYRIIRNFKKVYPYAAKTREILDSLNIRLSQMTDEREKKKLIKSTEKELFGRFEKQVRNMSFSQGKLLLKLIARETDQSAYNLIKTYKGTIPATFWYGVGLIFHENLKAQYDSLGEDALLEKIVLKYKQGKL